MFYRWQRQLFIAWYFAVALVVVCSLLPATSFVPRELSHLGIGDKAQHFLVYLALAFLPMMFSSASRIAVRSGVLLSVVGLVVEGAQAFTRTRTPDVRDAVLNWAGIACGITIGFGARAALRVLSAAPER